MKTTELLNAQEALNAMDQMINKPVYRSWIGNTRKEFNTLEQWFNAYGCHELNINTDKAYLDIFSTKKSIMINLKDKYTNKPIKKIYFNKDITNDFTLAYDGQYYNQAWSKSGNKIDIDGLGWTTETIKEYMLEYEIIPIIQENIEILKDNIRKYFN